MTRNVNDRKIDSSVVKIALENNIDKKFCNKNNEPKKELTEAIANLKTHEDQTIAIEYLTKYEGTISSNIRRFLSDKIKPYKGNWSLGNLVAFLSNPTEERLRNNVEIERNFLKLNIEFNKEKFQNVNYFEYELNNNLYEDIRAYRNNTDSLNSDEKSILNDLSEILLEIKNYQADILSNQNTIYSSSTQITDQKLQSKMNEIAKQLDSLPLESQRLNTLKSIWSKICVVHPKLGNSTRFDNDLIKNTSIWNIVLSCLERLINGICDCLSTNAARATATANQAVNEVSGAADSLFERFATTAFPADEALDKAINDRVNESRSSEDQEDKKIASNLYSFRQVQKVREGKLNWYEVCEKLAEKKFLDIEPKESKSVTTKISSVFKQKIHQMRQNEPNSQKSEFQEFLQADKNKNTAPVKMYKIYETISRIRSSYNIEDPEFKRKLDKLEDSLRSVSFDNDGKISTHHIVENIEGLRTYLNNKNLAVSSSQTSFEKLKKGIVELTECRGQLDQLNKEADTYIHKHWNENSREIMRPESAKEGPVFR